MKYMNADEVFPAELLKEIQKYVNGGMIYVPKPEGSRKKWGENTGARAYIKRRNEEIRKQYSGGISMDQLADQFFLSFESIKKIVYAKK